MEKIHITPILLSVPLIAIILGLVIYFGTKEGKASAVGYAIFVVGLFLMLWIATFRA
jgi:hypothetical protein